MGGIFFLRLNYKLIGEGKTTHTGLYAEDVVVHGEHIEGGVGGRVRVGLHNNFNLGVVNAREVASARGLVLLRLEREGIGVHAWVRHTRVVAVGLDLVEVLTRLLLEAVLTVENELEGVEGTHRPGGSHVGLLHPLAQRTVLATEVHGRARAPRGGHKAHVGRGRGIGLENDRAVRADVGGEVPEGGVGAGAGEAPHELLDGVVVGETHLLGAADLNRVGARVLDLLDEVLVALLGKAAALLGIEVNIIGPDLNSGAEELGENTGKIKI